MLVNPRTPVNVDRLSHERRHRGKARPRKYARATSEGRKVGGAAGKGKRPSGSGGFREFRGNGLSEGVGLNSGGAFRWNSGGRRGRESRNSAERGEGNRRRDGCAGVRWKGKFGASGGEGLLVGQGGDSAGF